MSKPASHPAMTAVESEAITHIGYDAPDRTLHVHFSNGGKYKFSDVSPQKYEALMAAESKGKHFMAHIRHHRDYEKY